MGLSSFLLFSRRPMLIIIPTHFEISLLAPSLIDQWNSRGIQLCVIGFGQIVAAARTLQVIHQHRPDRVLLLGLAGALKPSATVGQAIQFSEVVCDGIGVGQGESFQSASKMGWNQWAESPMILDRIALRNSASPPETCSPMPLLSVCSASLNQQEAEYRKATYPDAIAEDMEGFGVAVACQFARVPLDIIRGVSNQAGDRNFSNWNQKLAMNAAVKLADAQGLL